MRQEMTGGRAAAAGLAGSGAVAGVMALARRGQLTELEFPRIVATLLGRERPATRAAGWAVFLSNGVALALGYRAVLRLARREGGVARCAALGLAHGLLAAGAAALLSPLHPRPHRARLISETAPRPPPRELAVLVAVHAIYGAVLGAALRGRA